MIKRAESVFWDIGRQEGRIIRRALAAQLPAAQAGRATQSVCGLYLCGCEAAGLQEGQLARFIAAKEGRIMGGWIAPALAFF